MTSYRPGWSLRHALAPANAAELDEILKVVQCPACERQGTSPDLGEVYNRGMLLYREVICHCQCGFHHRLFVIINDIRRAETPLVSGSEFAMKRAIANGLVADPRLDEGFAHLMLAHHRGDLLQATELGEALIALSPNNPHAWFNLGWCYASVGRWFEGLAAFRQTCDLEDEYVEAIYHGSHMWYRLGYLEKGKELALVHHTLQPELKESLPETLEAGVSTFGKVAISKDPALLHLHIGDQDQGSVYLDPSASLCYPGVGGPGPFSPCFHVNGLLLAGIQHPNGHLLMMGLGLGAGVVALLHHLPKLQLTVVEADELVIRMAFDHLPLLEFFKSTRRLKVVHQKAQDFLDENQQQFDAGLLDLYQGENQQPHVQTAFLSQLHETCDNLWMNLIGSLSDDYVPSVLRRLEDIGKPASFLSASVSPRSWLKMDANWIVATERVDLEVAATFTPLQSFDGEALRILHGHLRMLQRWHLRTKGIENFLKDGSIPSFEV